MQLRARRVTIKGRMRLDEEKLEALRSWGERLRQSGSEESSAVGRAILMLIEEIDQLHIELWHMRLRETQPDEPVAATLQDRLQRVLGREPEPDPQPAPPEEAGPEAEKPSSPQSWIDALRRQS